MATQTDFTARIQRIEKQASKSQVRGRATRSFGSLMITPLMMVTIVCGGFVYAWDSMDRPTDTPFELASQLTAQVLSY